MTPTPPSTSSSAGHSPDAQYRVVRKRNRIPLSCAPCRHRKLKCNRGHPCDNCTKRGDTGSCTYASSSNRKKSSASASSNSPDDMQSRIDRLEGLVLSLMTNGPNAAGPTAAQAALNGSVSGSSPDMPLDLVGPDSIREEAEGDGEESEVEQVAKSIGVMKMDNNKTIFASEAHWYAILGEIAEVKNYFTEHKKQYEEQLRRYQAKHSGDIRPGMTYLLGGTKPASHQEILAAFPPKPTADLLVTRYFNTYDPAFHIIHGPTFQKQYDHHWQNPGETPVIWLGLVFAMMTIALQSYHRAGDEPPEYRGNSWQVANDYRRLTAQSLMLADITNPITHMLETLILNVYAEYSRSRDAEVGVLLSVSLIVRLAMRMGYHRDPGPYPMITPFQGEMRRRMWTAVRQADLLFSSQAGLPPMVRNRDTNTNFPRNLHDEELSEDMATLPPSRPLDEITPVSYMIAKAKLISVYGMVVEESQQLVGSSYEEIMKLDQRLREIHSGVPPHLQMRSIEESARDTSSVIMQRFSLELIYLKGLMVLHRKFLGASRENSRYAYSRRSCIDASMTMLQHQATLHTECQPGGRLRSAKWFISSLTTHDFLMAAMVVALDLYHTAESESQGKSPTTDVYLWSQDRREEMMAAMERAVTIWEGLRDHSMEAYKAHATLSVMVNRLKSNRGGFRQQPTTHPGFASPPSTYASASALEDPNVAPEHSAAMTLGMLSTGALTPNLYDTRQPYPSSMGSLLGSADVSGTQAPSGFGLNGDTGPANAPSPFSSLFGGSSLGFQSMEPPPTAAEVNWDAWDSYIQGAGFDAGNNMWPTTMDMPAMGSPMGGDALMGGAGTGAGATGSPSQQSQSQAQSQQAGQSNPFAGSGNLFMGLGV